MAFETKDDYWADWLRRSWRDVTGATDRSREDAARSDALDSIRNMPAPERVTSAVGNIQGDPASMEMQRNVLSRYQNLLGEGGMTAEDRAVASQLSRGIEGDASAARQTALADAQSRGMGGSGLEFTAALSGAQAGANRANQFGMDQAAQAQRRYLDALSGAGAHAGGMRGQQFGEQLAMAQANDTANRFNADLAQQAAQFRSGGTANLLTGNAVSHGNRALHAGDDAKDVVGGAVQVVSAAAAAKPENGSGGKSGDGGKSGYTKSGASAYKRYR